MSTRLTSFKHWYREVDINIHHTYVHVCVMACSDMNTILSVSRQLSFYFQHSIWSDVVPARVRFLSPPLKPKSKYLTWNIFSRFKMVICILYLLKSIYVTFHGIFYNVYGNGQSAFCTLIDHTFYVSSSNSIASQNCIVRGLLWCCIQ